MVEVVKRLSPCLLVGIPACHEFLKGLGEESGDGCLPFDGQMLDPAQEPFGQGQSDVLDCLRSTSRSLHENQCNTIYREMYLLILKA